MRVRNTDGVDNLGVRVMLILELILLLFDPTSSLAKVTVSPPLVTPLIGPSKERVMIDCTKLSVSSGDSISGYTVRLMCIGVVCDDEGAAISIVVEVVLRVWSVAVATATVALAAGVVVVVVVGAAAVVVVVVVVVEVVRVRRYVICNLVLYNC